ncbi:hypothetical protein ColKHC_14112 [Colletotrichum higginsianum]|nr:hypothetical protein ColKHC_14112 [Colletotrichum higginsianum]
MKGFELTLTVIKGDSLDDATQQSASFWPDPAGQGNPPSVPLALQSSFDDYAKVSGQMALERTGHEG